MLWRKNRHGLRISGFYKPVRFKECIYPYTNIRKINQERERILMHLDAIKADCDALAMDVEKSLRLKDDGKSESIADFSANGDQQVNMSWLHFNRMNVDSSLHCGAHLKWSHSYSQIPAALMQTFHFSHQSKPWRIYEHQICTWRSKVLKKKYCHIMITTSECTRGMHLVDDINLSWKTVKNIIYESLKDSDK